MADEIVKGTNGFTLVKQSEKWKPENGWQSVHIYEGPQALRRSYADTLILAGALDLDIGTGVPCQITATFPLQVAGWDSDGKAQDEAVWELIGEPVERRLQSHGKFNYSISSAAILERIDKAISDGTAADTDWDVEGAGLGEFNSYRNLRLMGVDSYDSYIYRVRASVTVSKESLLKASFADVGKVVAWSAIAIGTVTPAKAKFGQPVIHMCKPLNSGSWSDESVNEWLKQPPTVSWVKGQRKWRITQEWIGAVAMSDVLYDGGSLAV